MQKRVSVAVDEKHFRESQTAGLALLYMVQSSSISIRLLVLSYLPHVYPRNVGIYCSVRTLLNPCDKLP